MINEKTLKKRNIYANNNKMQKGITLIALIITIIVMLVLVGVSISVALNGGLFGTAKDATTNTEKQRDKELALANGIIEIDGKQYESYKKYLNNEYIVEWKETEKPTGWPENIKAMRYGTDIIPLPNGFEISNKETEDEVSEGLVITDGNNEFVWIPIETPFEESYNSANGFSEPEKTSQDTQSKLNEYYGTKEDGTPYYTIEDTNEYNNNVENAFSYKAHYEEMVESVNKYNGFYIGRYETTIDNGNIGSKEGATVLSADKILRQVTNSQGQNITYYYRWWGLYDVQRKANIIGNGTTIQTSMIWGQQWDAVIEFLDRNNKEYSPTTVVTLATSGKQNAGQAKYTYEGKTISDKICNIFDLRGNTLDWIAEENDNVRRTCCGGGYYSRDYASYHGSREPSAMKDYNGTRLTLYIK